MTETEWLASTDAVPMLEFLRHRVSDRQLRLFAVRAAGRQGHSAPPVGHGGRACRALR
jgi:hypothetical protein